MKMTPITMMNIMQSSQQGTCCCAVICQTKQMMAFLAYSHTQTSFEKQRRHDNEWCDDSLYC